MPSIGKWFPLQITTLISDYEEYNQILRNLINQCETPLKLNIKRIIEAEKRISSKIIRHENILYRWLEDVPSFRAEFRKELDCLQDMRNVCLNLRNKGRSSLKTGLTLVDQEQQKIVKNMLPKSKKKEAAPRLIDITL